MSYQPGLACVVALDKQLLRRDEFLLEIRECVLKAQEYMKATHDKDHRALEFEVGDWAWLYLHQRSVVAITDKSNTKLVP